MKKQPIYILLTLLTVIFCSSPSHALNDYTGKEILRDCSGSNKMVAATYCNGYVGGVIDSAFINGQFSPPPTFCIPKRVVFQTITKVILEYLRENPFAIDLSAAFLTQLAMEKEFPCSKKP